MVNLYQFYRIVLLRTGSFFLLLILLFTGCDKNEEDIKDGSKTKVSLTATIPGVGQTRALVGYGSSATSEWEDVIWEMGDQIKLRMYKVNGVMDSVLLSLSSEPNKSSGSFVSDLEVDSIGVYKFFTALYPSTFNNVLKGFEEVTQNGGSTEFLRSKMFMTATYEGSVVDGKLPSIKFTHQTALLHYRIHRAFTSDIVPTRIVLEADDEIFVSDLDYNTNISTYCKTITLNIVDAVWDELGNFHAYIPLIPEKSLDLSGTSITVYYGTGQSRMMTLSDDQMEVAPGSRYYFNLDSAPN